MDDDQTLVASASCGGTAGSCATGPDGRYQLTLTMPSADLSCVGQIDAVLGAPLATVGPNGSYYSASLAR